MRAASFVPSASGIKTFSISRTRRGNSVTIMDHLAREGDHRPTHLLVAQLPFHGVAIPLDEVDHAALAHLRIGAGLVTERVDADLVALDQRDVLPVGLVPDLG